MRPLFSQERVAASANSFLDGLLGDERRNTGWMRAEAAGGAGRWRQQAILGWGVGMRMLSGTSYATTPSSISAPMTRCWLSTKPGS
jgi:hypothetical protein